MFNKDFFPTGANVIEMMLQGETIKDKIILEPSAGKGDIVDYLTEKGANSILTCEINEDLRQILKSKSTLIADDFLSLTSDKISHIDLIVMNPPFSADDKHILHAYNIAPKGCRIISLCNQSTLENLYTNTRKELNTIIENYGKWESLGDCFTDAERKTGVIVGLIKIQKAGVNEKSEFDGFFMDEEPEAMNQTAGLMSYNVVRDLVNRYIQSVKIFDEQLTAAVKMNQLVSGFYTCQLGMNISKNNVEISKADFKKSMQISGWSFIFNKMNLTKNTTRGLMDDINKFVQQQTNIPFTMKNIYHMLDMVQQTTGQRMDKAILEAFDNITKHHADNREYIKGFKTNSHYLLGKKFIMPHMVDPAKSYGYTSDTYSIYSHRADMVGDLEKALCFCNGINYDEIKTLSMSSNRNVYGEWYESEFFKYKAFKVGTVHVLFKDLELLAKLNQHIAKLKGYPLFEGKAQTKYQERQTGRATQEKNVFPHKIISTIKLQTA